jgi:hypothetical protein
MNNIFDLRSGNIVGSIQCSRICDPKGNVVGKISGSDVIDSKGDKAGRIGCLKIYDVHDNVIGYASKPNIADINSVNVARCGDPTLMAGGAFLLLLSKKPST